MSACAGAVNLQPAGVHYILIYYSFTAQTASPNPMHQAPHQGAAEAAHVAKSSTTERGEDEVIRWISVGNVIRFDAATAPLQ